MRNIYVVAHPEATHHVQGVVGGWHDSQLTPAGARAAASIAEALRSRIPGDAQVELFSSDLQRALQTARVVGDLLDVEPVLDRRLREKSYGEAEGRPREWLDQRFVPPPAVGDRMGHDEGVPGAETKMPFAQRVYSGMDAILESSLSTRSYRDARLRRHLRRGVVASWIRMPIESLGYVNFGVASGSITLLREDDYFHNRQVVSLGDMRHLAP